ncbi:MAG: ribosome recycling factor [Trueperaceae bacterium]|nr:MAG: ribosome recycling factor [Trueperaceae bacterium]
MMKSVLTETRARMQKSLEAFEANIGVIRTGRANPAVLNRIQVDYYGATTPLNQLATVSSPDPRTLIITPFDKSIISDVEKAIQESDLGFNPNNQGDAIFITVPPLNDERRRELVKAAKHLAEETRVAVRNIRRSSNEELKEMQKENLLTEDDLRLGESEVQKLTDEFITRIEERVKSKEADIMEV